MSEKEQRTGPGRPPIYTQEELLEKTHYYFQNYFRVGDEVPSKVGLALYLEVAQRTIYEWAENDKNKEFSHMLDLIHSKQHQVLTNKSLNGEFNSNIGKLMLTKHGYSDKQDMNHSGGPINLIMESRDANTL